jgi:hypothetical protein
VCLKILVQVRTTGKEKMDIEGIPSFHMTAIGPVLCTYRFLPLNS